MTTVTDPITERVARLEGAYEHLATKADLAQMELRLTQEMAQVELRLTQEMANVKSSMAQEMARMESRMTWRMIGAMVGMSGAIITAVGLIVRFF